MWTQTLHKKNKVCYYFGTDFYTCHLAVVAQSVERIHGKDEVCGSNPHNGSTEPVSKEVSSVEETTLVVSQNLQVDKWAGTEAVKSRFQRDLATAKRRRGGAARLGLL
jgi:hypothetical protein